MNADLKCQKCPYKNGIVKTFVNPCISCHLGKKPIFGSGTGRNYCRKWRRKSTGGSQQKNV